MALENNYAVVHSGIAYCAALLHERNRCAFYSPSDDGDLYDESPRWILRNCMHLNGSRCMNMYAKEDALR